MKAEAGVIRKGLMLLGSAELRKRIRISSAELLLKSLCRNALTLEVGGVFHKEKQSSADVEWQRRYFSLPRNMTH